MKWFIRSSVVVLPFVICLTLSAQWKARQSHNAVYPNFPVQQFQQGYGMKLWMNNWLILGNAALPEGIPSTCWGNGVGFEYPVGSCIEHLYGAGPVIGGIIDGVRYVSEAFNPRYGYGFYFPPRRDSTRKGIWVSSRNDTVYDAHRGGYYKIPPGKRSYDDDYDGRIDEDELDGYDNDDDWNRATDDLGADGLPDSAETGCKGGFDPLLNPDPAYDNYDPSKIDSCTLSAQGRYLYKNKKDRHTQNNGIPDHGEPHVDEDYGAISDQDVYISATDTVPISPYVTNLPMKVRITMKSYAWESEFTAPAIPIEYKFVNIGQQTIRDVYLGMFCDPEIVSVIGTDHSITERTGYIDSLRTVYVSNPIERYATPLGLTLLHSTRSLGSLTTTYLWYETLTPYDMTNDSVIYDILSCQAPIGVACIKEDQPQNKLANIRFFITVGPFEEMRPFDTLRLGIAFVSGDALDLESNSLVENAISLISFHRNGYKIVRKLPSPCLDISTDEQCLTLRWGRKPGCIDPRDLWDEFCSYTDSLPINHWRRFNPPYEGAGGGRIFEGYRIYRSEDHAGTPESFTLLKEFDVADDPFGYNQGIDTVFQDTTARRGKTYWYAVTAFSIPDRIIREYVTDTGVVYGALHVKGYESGVTENAKKIYFPYGHPQSLGTVKVVPNPYRSDAIYTDQGGYEGPSRSWNPAKRLVRFIDVPSKATIRIYTVAGEVIHTLYHDEASGSIAGQEDFILLSESGRALAPGIYVFTVESAYGTQTGKFVVIY